jgi:hypothetical protein
MFRVRMMHVMAAVMLLALGACADRPTPLAPADPMLVPDVAGATAAVSAVARFPNATFTMALLPQDIPPFIPSELADLLIGDWEIDFTDPRHSVARVNGEVAAEGPWIATPARLITRDVSGDLACVGPGYEQGVYGWSLDNGELTLTAVQDRCDGRVFILTAKPWTMQ